jgi:predicted transglutaminase-like cysteine proteinase
MRGALNKEITPAKAGGSPQERLSIRSSFFRAVGRQLKCMKLGHLLVSSGLITEAELNHALELQKASGEQLGTILIREGLVSAVSLYRKLAEQWCLKATAAGMTMLMHTLAPSTAHASDERIAPQFQMAAAAVNPAAWRPLAEKPSFGMQYPGLFGTQETRSDDISAFRKWTTVMARFEDQMRSQASTPRMLMWKAELQSLKGMPEKQQIEAVDAYINQVRYIEDKNNYGKSDYWATPTEFFARGGDCEDFAIAKYASLRALGFSSDQLRIAIVQDTIKNIPHAVLIVYSEGQAYVLDNQSKRTQNAMNVAHYQPIFSINSTSWWLHKKAVS